jgi:hypothetical protein
MFHCRAGFWFWAKPDKNETDKKAKQIKADLNMNVVFGLVQI